MMKPSARHAFNYEAVKVEREHGDGVERSCAGGRRGGRAVIPVLPHAVDGAAVRPDQVRVARLDARSLGTFSACPTCPTCPTKIGKREGEESVSCRSFSTRFAPAASSRLGICSRRSDRLTWLDSSQRHNGARLARERRRGDLGGREVDGAVGSQPTELSRAATCDEAVGRGHTNP
jgi:hypothetical protein